MRLQGMVIRVPASVSCSMFHALFGFWPEACGPTRRWQQRLLLGGIHRRIRPRARIYSGGLVAQGGLGRGVAHAGIAQRHFEAPTLMLLPPLGRYLASSLPHHGFL